MPKKLTFSNVTQDDDDVVSLDNLHEAQANAGPKHLQDKKVLLLNADYSPLSYKPLSTVPWTDVFFWLTKGWQRVKDGGVPIINVVDYYKGVYVHSGNDRFELPSVVALTKMTKLPERAAMTRENIFLRDDFTCQYTGIKYPTSELNLDHVIPQAQGGKSTWQNLVACHKQVNFDKADRTPREAGLRLLRVPYAPNAWELREKGRSYPSKLAHESWADYVYWNVKLNED